jgi:hypothetical protein
VLSKLQLAALATTEKHQSILEDKPAQSIEEANATEEPEPNVRRKRISIGVFSETNANSRYMKTQFSLDAYDTWKQGILSEIKTTSRAFQEQEKTRLSNLRQTTYSGHESS